MDLHGVALAVEKAAHPPAHSPGAPHHEDPELLPTVGGDQVRSLGFHGDADEEAGEVPPQRLPMTRVRRLSTEAPLHLGLHLKVPEGDAVKALEAPHRPHQLHPPAEEPEDLEVHGLDGLPALLQLPKHLFSVLCFPS